MSLLLLLVGAGALTPRSGASQPPPPERAQTEALSRSTRERIRLLQREADELAARERTLLGELRRLELDRRIKNEELRRLDGELTDTARQLETTTARMQALEEALAAGQPQVAARLVALYKLGRPGYARLLLGVRDLKALGRTSRLVAALAAQDRRTLDAYRQRLAALAATRQTLDARQQQMRRLQEEARRTRAALDRAIAAQTDLIHAIDAQRDLNAQLLGELQAAYERLQATLGGLAAASTAEAAPAAPPGRVGPPAAGGAGGRVRVEPGELDWPVTGRVTIPFGRHRQTRYGTTIVRYGIEIAAAEGAAVRAVQAGQVAFADAFTGFGNLVILDHGGEAYSLYGYLADLDVSRGSHVDRGARLGTVGRAPAGGPALYFELRIDGQPVDPLQWLRKVSPR